VITGDINTTKKNKEKNIKKKVNVKLKDAYYG
jgi:hypothetical protein